MYRSIVRLDKNLREFTKAVSKLGGSPTLRQDVDDFGDLLGHLLHLLKKALSSLPESTIETIKSSVKLFHTDWESCLKEHEGQSLNCIEFVMLTLLVQNNITPHTFGYT